MADHLDGPKSFLVARMSRLGFFEREMASARRALLFLSVTSFDSLRFISLLLLWL